MGINVRTTAGYVLVVVVIGYYFWAMHRQLRRLRQGHMPGTRFGHLHGYGALLYNLLETANIAAVSFFVVHIAYILTRDYRLANIKYGLIGIGIGIILVRLARWLLLLVRVGPTYCSRIVAAGWIALLSGVLAFGIWSIFITGGKVLEMQIPDTRLDLIVTALVPLVTFAIWMAILYTQIE